MKKKTSVIQRPVTRSKLNRRAPAPKIKLGNASQLKRYIKVWIDNTAREAYETLINESIENPYDGYTEKHHILPKSLGGHNDAANLVRLRATNHLLAHYWLWKGTRKREMATAYLQMVGRSLGKMRDGVWDIPDITQDMMNEYEKGKLKHSAWMSTRRGEKSPTYGKPGCWLGVYGADHPNFGRKFPEAGKKISAAKLGKPGWKWSEEQKKAVSERMKAQIAKHGAPKQGFKVTEESKRKCSLAQPNRRPVLRIDEESLKAIERFDCIMDADKATGIAFGSIHANARRIEKRLLAGKPLFSVSKNGIRIGTPSTIGTWLFEDSLHLLRK